MEQESFRQRWDSYRATKTVVFWSAIMGATVTVIIGFSAGGWMRAVTAKDMAATAAAGARAELAAAICVDRYSKGPGMTAKLASLKALDSWKRDTVIEEGGWVTLPGVAKPVEGAAALCAQQLIDAKPPLVKAAGAAG